jgi:hypothetical protein
MIRERRPRRSSAGRRPRDPATVTGRLLAVQAQDLRRGASRGAGAHARLTAVDVDRALTDERSLAVMWLNRGTRQQKQKAPKRLAKAKCDRRQRGAVQANRRLTRSFTRARAVPSAA